MGHIQWGVGGRGSWGVGEREGGILPWCMVMLIIIYGKHGSIITGHMQYFDRFLKVCGVIYIYGHIFNFL